MTCGISAASRRPDRRNFFAWRPLPDAPGTAANARRRGGSRTSQPHLLAYTKAPATTFTHFSPLRRSAFPRGERQGPGAAQEPCRFPVFRRDFSRPPGQRCAGRDEAVLRGGRIPVRHPYRKEASRPRTASSSPARDGHGWTCLTRWLSWSPWAGPHRVRAADTDYVCVDRPAECDRVTNGRAGESGNLQPAEPIPPHGVVVRERRLAVPVHAVVALARGKWHGSVGVTTPQFATVLRSVQVEGPLSRIRGQQVVEAALDRGHLETGILRLHGK